MFRYNSVPLEESDNGRIAAAFAEPGQLMLLDAVSLLLGKRIIIRVATLRQISQALQALGKVAKAHETDENITHKAESPPEESLGHDDTDAPVRAPLKPKPHQFRLRTRSGAAKAVPEQEQ